MGISKQQQQQQQQPLLRKIHSRTSATSNHPIVPQPLPIRIVFQQRLQRCGVVVVRQLPTIIIKYSICSFTTTKQIIISLFTIDTIIGIKIGFFLFFLLQHVSRGSNNSSTTSLSTTITGTTTSNQLQQQQQQASPIVIGYAVSITGCGHDPITEGAAILQHSIHRASVRYRGDGDTNSNNGSSGKGRYDYQMYAIYHPSAKECAMTLQDLGYTLLERETPVPVSDIQGEYLRMHITENGCCGEKELIKLYAYTLIQHPIIVHLDLDTIVIQPLDALFDYMLLLPPTPNSLRSTTTEQVHQTMKEMVMWPDVFPPPPSSSSSSSSTDRIDALFTLDYNMVLPKTKYKPVQGGFLLLRPDIQVYEEFVQLIRIGDFRSGSGWGGLVGPFYGSMTFQGIIPYYYNVLHPGHSLELNRCYYNTMADNPRTEKTVNDIVHGPCRTGQPEDVCQDCRTVPLSQIYTVHYTICQKPWSCLSHNEDIIQHRLCRNLTHEWYKIRYDYQNHVLGDGSFDKEQFYGYCQRSGSKGYIPIPKTYYSATAAEKTK